MLAAASLSAYAQNRPSAKPLPHRVFATSRKSLDTVLARPYDSDVPFGASGDRVWATSPQGNVVRHLSTLAIMYVPRTEHVSRLLLDKASVCDLSVGLK